MKADELLSFTRYNKLRDKAIPPLWKDDTLLLYLNEGQDRLAAQTDYFVDDEVEIALSSGTDVYDLDPAVCMVYSVRLEGYEFVRLQPATEGWTPDCTYTSRPSRYTLDRATNKLRIFPTPDTDYTAILRVARKPEALSLDTLDVDCELPDDMLIAVMDWAAYRCFTEDDADGRNDMAAEKAFQRYNEAMNRFKRDNYRLRMGFGARAHGQRVK